MELKSGFFNDVNGDRLYNAEDMNRPYSRVISDGVFAFPSEEGSSTDFQVVATNSLKIVVKKGFGMFNSHWCENEKDVEMTIPMPNVNFTRIDSIIVRVDESLRKTTLEYIQGEASASPVAPIITRTSDIMEYRLANITIQANATSITQSNIEDTRPTSECGFISNLLWNSDITTTYSQWKSQFHSWFDDIKETLVSATAMVSRGNNYTTTAQDETEIPIGIASYNNGTDVLQVFVNSLLCIPNVDYEILDYTKIKLTKPVDSGTVISFILYKSIDTTDSEKAVDVIYDLNERVAKLEDITEGPLWSGNDVVGANSSITPVKKLSNCKNGWILCWGVSNNDRINSTYVPKKLLKNAGENFNMVIPLIHAFNDSGVVEQTAKRIYIYDNKINGYAGNAASLSNNITLRYIYEF